ncbi:glycerol-3-phosphate dehydrogenase [Methylobacterium oxalidis]|uniref:Glycerol-3-phosphate dehydrogenase n=1 Tax=Methylobacterium oxalidis TaxID=944322 RepID=A0A512J0B3_9HYPH|nr:glycerol-3-phosphate dehydrogenase [Methylobacterium oxalidis]GEP03382.1 glycerol-3-phosphate dehydrogenase [Methylobacterium oxalidis]GJE33040.1 D-erythritol 1-phosphate dehydrogenase [Methylobacterium oxalidis]GLS63423.1 glycerol-3-phosphate dehydrogenase [Methylobacterium oxalidis]
MDQVSDHVDFLVIGGGINGTGIARDAAGRGLSVMLCEQGDLAEATSSSSTKLIHGGLRYLEQYEFRLVREALAERERLLRLAPHIIWPLRFVLPHDEGLRPAWLLRLGLFLYDHLSRLRVLPGSESLRLRESDLGAPLQARLTRGFAYSDCWVEDSRLVVLNARDAADRGAEVRTRTRVEAARRSEDGTAWNVRLRDLSTGVTGSVRARAIVNAAGPWVAAILGQTLGLDTRATLRLVKGSHIVVRRLYAGEQAYILQQPDRRIIFAIPYERDFTLIGTTDVAYDGAPGPVTISPEETAYLCACINRSFERQICPADVVWSYSGVRPLYDDAAADASTVTRDYVLDLAAADGAAPVLSVFGGKITTYRRLAEHAMEKLRPYYPGLRPAWTGAAPLPGGDMAGADFETFLARFAAHHPFLAPETARRLARAYGTRAERIVADARGIADLGERFEADLTAAEIAYLRREEWARTAEDILWRRTKLGLRTSAEGLARLERHLAHAEAAA